MLNANSVRYRILTVQDWLEQTPEPAAPQRATEKLYKRNPDGSLVWVEWFHNTRQAQVAINVWLRQYNQIRPHHALKMKPPVPETLLENAKMNGRI